MRDLCARLLHADRTKDIRRAGRPIYVHRHAFPRSSVFRRMRQLLVDLHKAHTDQAKMPPVECAASRCCR